MKVEAIINEREIDDVSESIYTTITSNIQKYLGKNLGWIIDLVVSHTITISKYNPLAGGNYIKLPKESDDPKKARIILKISVIMNALNGVWLDTNILQIIIQQELERLTNYMETN